MRELWLLSLLTVCLSIRSATLRGIKKDVGNLCAMGANCAEKIGDTLANVDGKKALLWTAMSPAVLLASPYLLGKHFAGHSRKHHHHHNQPTSASQYPQQPYQYQQHHYKQHYQQHYQQPYQQPYQQQQQQPEPDVYRWFDAALWSRNEVALIGYSKSHPHEYLAWFQKRLGEMKLQART